MAAELAALESEFSQAFEARRTASMGLAEAGNDNSAARETFRSADARLAELRSRAAGLARAVGEANYKDFSGDTPTPDVNYVFPTFVTTKLPIGLVGLIIAAIFAAAMSSIAAELNSLATVDRDRHLPAIAEAGGVRFALSARVADHDGVLGDLRVHRGEVRRGPRIADRSRQSFRLVLLRIAARVSSCWRCSSADRTVTVRSSACLPASRPSPRWLCTPRPAASRFSGTIRWVLSSW